MRLRLKTGAIGDKSYDPILSCLIYIYCLALPFEEALASSFGSILRIIAIAIICYSAVVYFRRSIKFSNLRLALPFAGWFLLMFLSVLWSDNFAWWKYFVQIYAFQIVLMLVVLAYQDFVNMQYIKNGVITGAVIAAGIVIFIPSSSILTEDGRRTIIMYGNEFDPNILASIMMLALILLLDELFRKRTKTTICLALCLFAGMLFTGSRGALIATTVGAGYYLLQNLKNKGTRHRTIWWVVVGIVAIVAMLMALPEELFMSRFTFDKLLGLDEYQAGTHNRWIIWEYALPLALKAPLFGYGCGNFFSEIAKVYRECASHNLYLLLLIEGGIVCLSIFIIGLRRIFVVIRSRKQYEMVALMLSVGVMAFTLDAITCKFYWVSLMISILSATKNKEVNC